MKVEDDLAVMAHNGGTGITTVDVSDPTDPEELAFHDAHHVHNAFLKDGYAYLTISESDENTFSEARTDIVDVSDPMDPKKIGEYRLADDFPEFAAGGLARTTTSTSKTASSIRRTGMQASSSRT
ncbi:LVIVD repeat-containing protein [Halalkalicoccus salilacus]|uniref:hypothetical protein n=1 Tax=Halalkalicoccus sp. GCM10025704 TaxID=3252662 RepID=UPI003609CC02